MDNKMKEVCALFGLSFGETFVLMPVYTADRFTGFGNPYHFTDKGLVDGTGG